MKQKFYSQVNMERIFFLAGVRRDGSAPAKEDGVRLRIIEAAPIGAIQGGGAAARRETAPGAS
jgi:hypothetical protein